MFFVFTVVPTWVTRSHRHTSTHLDTFRHMFDTYVSTGRHMVDTYVSTGRHICVESVSNMCRSVSKGVEGSTHMCRSVDTSSTHMCRLVDTYVSIGRHLCVEQVSTSRHICVEHVSKCVEVCRDVSNCGCSCWANIEETHITKIRFSAHITHINGNVERGSFQVLSVSYDTISTVRRPKAVLEQLMQLNNVGLLMKAT